MSPTGTETILYSFTGGADGGAPFAGLIRDSAGNLYGTTSGGGAYGAGVVFKLSPTGTVTTVLYSFTGGTDGGVPEAGLIQDAAGNLYGTTLVGGAQSSACFGDSCGVVFKLTLAGTQTVLHSFSGGADGANPYLGSLVRDGAGNLYGTTASGGAKCSGCAFSGNCGVVFKVSPSGTYTVLHRFTGEAGGANPYAGLLRDAAGNLYGTTAYGGASSTCNPPYGRGVVFKLSPTGTETVLHSFTGGADGAAPVADLIRDAAGNLYGTTYQGGAFGCGVVFKVSATGTETVLHTFTGTEGSMPQSGLIQDAAGNLYGTATGGGTYHAGVVFRLAP